MRLSLLFSILTLMFLAPANRANAQSMIPADTMAMSGHYAEASEAYEAILAGGQESADLYYNLGYSYFKQGMLGKAIVNFERSRRLNPSDDDVRVNLEQAYALTDKMQVVEPLFFEKWGESFKDMMGSDGWGYLFVMLFFVALAGVGAFLFSDSIGLRKTGFFAAIALLGLSFLALSISLQKRSDILESDEAIIMASSVNLLTSPDKNGSQMAVLHEGTHLDILDEVNEWVEVRLRDGDIGWVKKTEIERI